MVTRDALRWREGERLARATRTEHIAIGFQVREYARIHGGPGQALAPFRSELMWVELANLATDPRGEFVTDEAELVAVLNKLGDEFGDGNVRAHAMWHNHFNLAAPSPFDVQFFPPWLSIGVVWFEPRDTMVLYDGTGIFDDPSLEDVVAPLAASYGTTH